MNKQNRTNHKKILSLLFWAIFTAVLAPCFILFPSILAYPPDPDPSVPTFMIWVVNVMNHPTPIVTGLGLLAIGSLLGFAKPRLCWLIAPVTQLPLIIGFLVVMVWAIINGQPYSQTPILIVCFSILTLPPVYLGVVSGYLFQRFIFRKNKNSNQCMKPMLKTPDE